MLLPNGIATNYSYDALNRLTGIQHYKTNIFNTLGQYTYTLAANGNRIGASEYEVQVGGGVVTRTNTWGYDDMYRLVTETTQITTSTALTNLYTYDKTGNRLALNANGSATTYNYNELDQLTSIISNGVTILYSYDVRGNLKQIGSGSSATTYTWDAQDRLGGVVLPSNNSATYGYDFGGRRVNSVVTKTVGGGSIVSNTNYLWDEFSSYGDVIVESDGSNGTWQVGYVIGTACSCPHNIQQLISQNRTGNLSYYLFDGLGSVRALIDNTTGLVSEKYDYNVFGNMLNSSANSANIYLYQGQQFDVLTGLYNMRARYYDKNQGRFLTRDFYKGNRGDPSQLNRYKFTSDSPINSSDPTGLDSFTTFPLTSIPRATTTPPLAFLGYSTLNYIAGLGIAALAIAARSSIPCVKMQTLLALTKGEFLCVGFARSRIDGTSGLAGDAIKPFDELRNSPGITTYNDVYGEDSPPPWFVPKVSVLMFAARRIIFDVRGLEPEDAV